MRIALFAALVYAAPSLAAAQQAGAPSSDSAKVLDPVIVTAARREERRTSSVVSAAVITRADIESTGASDVASVIQQQAGVQIAPGNPVGAAVYLQGLGDQRVLVMLDGEPLVGRVGGSFDLSRLPTSAVERIEIVQGPQSVLYGSDALGGVINIITRSPSPRASRSILAGTEVSVIAGSHDRVDISGALGSRIGDTFAYRIDGGHRDIALTPGLANDRSTHAARWDVSPRLTWSPSATTSFDVAGLATVENQRYRTGQLFNFSDNVQVGAHAAGSWQVGTSRFSPRVSYSSFEHLSRAAASGRPASDSGALDVQTLATAALAYTGLARGAVVDAGAEVRREAISADRIAGRDRSVDGGALYGQATYAAGPLSLMPGARVTWNDEWGTAVTPRLALLARPLGDGSPLALRASVGRGFRAPDFKELYLNFVNAAAGYAVNGNPALRPEHSTNYSASAEWASDALDARAAAFYNRFRDFIETTGPDSRGIYTYSNVSRGRTSGLELELARSFRWVGLRAAYDYLDTHDDATGGQLLGRAAHAARVTSTFAPFGFRTSVAAIYTGSTPASRDESGAVAESRGAFTQMNLRIARQLPAAIGAELSFGVDDLFNAQAGNGWPGFTGRQVYVGASWTGR